MPEPTSARDIVVELMTLPRIPLTRSALPPHLRDAVRSLAYRRERDPAQVFGDLRSTALRHLDAQAARA